MFHLVHKQIIARAKSAQALKGMIRSAKGGQTVEVTPAGVDELAEYFRGYPQDHSLLSELTHVLGNSEPAIDPVNPDLTCEKLKGLRYTLYITHNHSNVVSIVACKNNAPFYLVEYRNGEIVELVEGSQIEPSEIPY